MLNVKIIADIALYEVQGPQIHVHNVGFTVNSVTDVFEYVLAC